MGGGPTQAVIIADSSGDRLVITSGRLLVDLSGTTITATTNISGQSVYLASGQNLVHVSGQTVYLASGSNIINISGNAIQETYGSVVTAAYLSCTNLSGGTIGPTQGCASMQIKNLSGNGMMYLGGIGTQAPFSGKGMVLMPNESRAYQVNNFNTVRVFAVTSGQNVAIDGVL